MSEQQDSLGNFAGMVRLFPLPNLVVFPHVLQPLHIFEPRYRELTRDALDGDRLIGMASLQPDWEGHYDGKPAIYPVVCVCKIVADQAQTDGRFNLLVRGMARAKVLTEVDSDKLYRQARVELLPGVPLKNKQTAQHFRDRLQELIPDWFPDQPAVLSEFSKLLNGDIALGMACDIIAFALPLPAAFKQTILAEPDDESRATLLLERLTARKHRQFPPGFSCN